MDHNVDSGGIVGDNLGTLSGCTFEGEAYAATVGGIAGANGGTVTDCHNLIGIVSTGNRIQYVGAIIGHIYTNTNNYNKVIIEDNTYNRVATGQQWGIGYDRRLSPAGPSNIGTTQIN